MKGAQAARCLCTTIAARASECSSAQRKLVVWHDVTPSYGPLHPMILKWHSDASRATLPRHVPGVSSNPCTGIPVGF
eukprot:5843041-Amphidinium_carterae.2